MLKAVKFTLNCGHVYTAPMEQAPGCLDEGKYCEQCEPSGDLMRAPFRKVKSLEIVGIEMKVVPYAD